MFLTRPDLRIILGAFIAGLLVAVIVGVPRWLIDSRPTLEVVFSEVPAEGDPTIKLRYDRGRGFHSLRVVEGSERRLDGDCFTWTFDARPVRAIQLGVTGWDGSLAIESAILKDGSGEIYYQFNPDMVRMEAGGGAYPVTDANPIEYYKIVLPTQGDAVLRRPHRLSGKSLVAVALGFFLGGGVFWMTFQCCRLRPFSLRWVDYFRCEYPVMDPDGVPRKVIYPSVLVLVVVVIWRSWENFKFPSLFVEDAFHYFNLYYGDGVEFWDAVMRHPHGYINVLPNLLAWIFAKGDVRWVPSLYVAVGLITAMLASTIPACSGRFRNPWILFIVPLVLGLSGMNHIFYYTTMTYLMYVSVLILMGLLLLPAPQSWVGLVLRALVSVVLIFSGPYSVVAFPLGLFLLFCYRPSKQSFLWAIVAFFCIVFMETTNSGMMQIGNAFDLEVLRKMGVVMVDRVFFLEFGTIPMGVGLLGVVGVLAGLYWMLWRDPHFRRVGTAMLSIVALAMAPLFLSQKFQLYPDPYACHVLVSQFFWLLFWLYSADCLVRRFPQVRLLAPAFVVLFTILVVADQYAHPRKRACPPNREIAEYLERIRAAESLRLEEANEFVILRETSGAKPEFHPIVKVGSRRADAVERSVEELNLP